MAGRFGMSIETVVLFLSIYSDRWLEMNFQNDDLVPS